MQWLSASPVTMAPSSSNDILNFRSIDDGIAESMKDNIRPSITNYTATVNQDSTAQDGYPSNSDVLRSGAIIESKRKRVGCEKKGTRPSRPFYHYQLTLDIKTQV